MKKFHLPGEQTSTRNKSARRALYTPAYDPAAVDIFRGGYLASLFRARYLAEKLSRQTREVAGPAGESADVSEAIKRENMLYIRDRCGNTFATERNPTECKTSNSRKGFIRLQWSGALSSSLAR